MKSFLKLLISLFFLLFSFSKLVYAQNNDKGKSFYTTAEIKEMCGVPIDSAQILVLKERQKQQSQNIPSNDILINKIETIPNWQWAMSDVENQGFCGDCWKHAATGIIEGQLQIGFGSRIGSTGIDLNETEIPGSCDAGGFVSTALSHIQMNKIGSEIGSYPNYQGTKWSLLSFDYLSGITNIKNALQNGPVSASFIVYADFGPFFFNNPTGVYHYDGNSVQGDGHAVVIVSYNDSEQYWLCKNSWGSSWADNGYFRIGYNQCFIDTWSNQSVAINQNCYSKIVPNLQTFQNAVTSNWVNNELAYILENVVIESGSLIIIQPNSSFVFVPGVSISNNGTLNAIGTTTNKINFNLQGNSGSWGGIVFNPGSSGSIEYCDIRRATTGITCNSVLPSIRYNNISGNTTGISISNISTPENEVSFNSIQYNFTRGIYLSSASPKIYNNTISNNSNYGVYCTNSSPFLANNAVSGHTYSGLKFSYYSSARFGSWNPSGSYWGAGHNIISGNSGTGVSADYYSNLLIGHSMAAGFNSIFGNTSYELYGVYGCSIVAENNWWGANPPSSGEFSMYQSTVDYSPALTTDPNSPGQYRIPGSGKETGLAVSDPEVSDLEAGYRLQLAGKFDEAVALYKNLIETNSTDPMAATALLRIRECYNWMGKGSFSAYLENLSAQKSDATDELGLVFRDMNTQILVENNKFNEAIANLDIQAEAFKTNAYAHKYSLFNAGFIYLRYLNDVEKAKAKFDELAVRYPKDDLVSESNYLLGESVDSNSPQQALANPTDEKSAVPTQYGLSQNYPNPFNPSTTLRYQTPEKGLVQLKVYDLMGREVAVLVNTVKDAGYYELLFDANSVNGGLSSGVYLFKIQVNSFTTTQKMVLLK